MLQRPIVDPAADAHPARQRRHLRGGGVELVFNRLQHQCAASATGGCPTLREGRFGTGADALSTTSVSEIAMSDSARIIRTELR